MGPFKYKKWGTLYTVTITVYNRWKYYKYVYHCTRSSCASWSVLWTLPYSVAPCCVWGIYTRFFSPVQGVDCFRCTAPHIHPLTMGDELAEQNSSWLVRCAEKISTQPWSADCYQLTVPTHLHLAESNTTHVLLTRLHCLVCQCKHRARPALTILCHLELAILGVSTISGKKEGKKRERIVYLTNIWLWATKLEKKQNSETFLSVNSKVHSLFLLFLY